MADRDPKRLRMKLVKAELLVILAVKTLEWQRDITDAPGCGTIPFAEWPEDDPFRVLATLYDLTPADLGKLLDQLGDDLENRAERLGYADYYERPRN